MPLNRGAIVSVMEQISIEKGLKCTVTESLKGAVTIGACAFAGGLFGGPVGIGVGGTLGSVLAAIAGSGKFKSVVTVLREEMTPEQLSRLENSMKAIFQDIDATDVVGAVGIIMSSPNIQEVILRELGVFLKEEMALQLAQ